MWNINAPSTLLVLDWDGTLAATDTLSLIAPSPDALKPYTEAYIRDMSELSSKFGDRNSLESMTEWLEAMKEIEFTSVKRVEDGGLFKGMKSSDMLDRARNTNLLSLHNGATDMLKNFRGSWGIISVGWSGRFIRAALEARGVDLTSKDIQIRANEVEFDEAGVGTGRISKHQGNDQAIRIAQDKKREMAKMVKEWRESAPGLESGKVVYVGDSETDLLCLLAADLGVIMHSDGMVKKCRSLGLNAQPGLADLFESGPQVRYVDDFKSFI